MNRPADEPIDHQTDGRTLKLHEIQNCSFRSFCFGTTLKMKMPQEVLAAVSLRGIVVISWLLGFNFFSIPSQGEFLEICVIFVFVLPQHGGDDNNDVLAFLLLYSSKFSAVYIVCVSVGGLVRWMDGCTISMDI